MTSYDMLQMHFKLVNSDASLQDFENWIYLTQSMQAFCIKSETEHYRRSRSMEANTMGAIYWQLNNIWQGPTWSGLEYGGRWKMLHYYVKNMFNKYLISGYEHPDNLFNIHATSDDVMVRKVLVDWVNYCFIACEWKCGNKYHFLDWKTC